MTNSVCRGGSGYWIAAVLWGGRESASLSFILCGMSLLLFVFLSGCHLRSDSQEGKQSIKPFWKENHAVRTWKLEWGTRTFWLLISPEILKLSVSLCPPQIFSFVFKLHRNYTWLKWLQTLTGLMWPWWQQGGGFVLPSILLPHIFFIYVGLVLWPSVAQCPLRKERVA
jgi:hypothetical protein